MLAGPLTGIYDPTGTGRILFAFFAAMAETERENIREGHPRRTHRRSPQGKLRRPPAGHHRRHAAHRSPAPRERRVSRTDPTGPDHPTGKRKGQHPSPASIYRALAEHDKAQAYPEAIDQAHADFAALQAST